MSEACQPIFRIGGEISYPGVPLGTIRLEISSSPVRAVIVTHALRSVPAFVMKIFEPFTTHCPCESSARVRVAPASDPAPGSVRPNAARRLSRGEIRKPRLLLLVGPEEKDRHRSERRVGGDRDRDRGVDPGELLDRDGVAERVAPAASVLLGDRDSQEPELRQLGDELVGEAVLAVELLGHGSDALLGELAHRPPQELVLVREVEVH